MLSLEHHCYHWIDCFEKPILQCAYLIALVVIWMWLWKFRSGTQPVALSSTTYLIAHVECKYWVRYLLLECCKMLVVTNLFSNIPFCTSFRNCKQFLPRSLKWLKSIWCVSWRLSSTMLTWKLYERLDLRCTSETTIYRACHLHRSK